MPLAELFPSILGTMVHDAYLARTYFVITLNHSLDLRTCECHFPALTAIGTGEQTPGLAGMKTAVHIHGYGHQRVAFTIEELSAITRPLRKMSAIGRVDNPFARPG